jgi:hypothetical protein
MSDQDTQYAAKATANSIYAVDFGTGAALAIHGPDGPISKKSLALPRVVGGKTPRDEFRLILEALLALGDVVVESPTVGSSGCEPDDVREIVASSPNRLYTLSARVVKNYRMDFDVPNPKSYPKYETVSEATQEEAHVLDAEILYMVATDHRERLRLWHEADPCERIHRSVRPMDKRGYRDERSEQFMSVLPPFETLPDELKAVLGGKKAEYSRSAAMPFAMSLTEPIIDDGPPEKARRRYEKLIGLYDHGYPSFYRRATINWMQTVAKQMAGVTRMQEVPADVRKAAWKTTQRQIRMLFHLSRT